MTKKKGGSKADFKPRRRKSLPPLPCSFPSEDGWMAFGQPPPKNPYWKGDFAPLPPIKIPNRRAPRPSRSGRLKRRIADALDRVWRDSRIPTATTVLEAAGIADSGDDE